MSRSLLLAGWTGALAIAGGNCPPVARPVSSTTTWALVTGCSVAIAVAAAAARGEPVGTGLALLRLGVGWTDCVPYGVGCTDVSPNGVGWDGLGAGTAAAAAAAAVGRGVDHVGPTGHREAGVGCTDWPP